MVTLTDGGGVKSSAQAVYSYHGFIPDLISALSKRLRFDYELYNVSDSYGQLINSEWTGLIGEVMRRDVRTFIRCRVILWYRIFIRQPYQ